MFTNFVKFLIVMYFNINHTRRYQIERRKAKSLTVLRVRFDHFTYPWSFSILFNTRLESRKAKL